MNHLLHNCLMKPPYEPGRGEGHHIKTTGVLVRNVEDNSLEVLIFGFGNGLNLFFTP